MMSTTSAVIINVRIFLFFTTHLARADRLVARADRSILDSEYVRRYESASPEASREMKGEEAKGDLTSNRRRSGIDAR